MANHKVICISRQVGSGGHEIGEKLAEELHIPFYDRKLITLAAERSGLDEETLEASDERRTDPLLYTTLYEVTQTAFRDMPATELTFRVQRDIILDVAKKESCIIMGRCADAILKDVEGIDLIRLFIAAPTAKRVARLMEHDQLSEKDAMAYIRKREKRRKAYYDFHTERKWGNPANYDICINSAKFGIDGTVKLLKDAF